MAGALNPWQRLAAVATLGTSRAPLPADELWPDASLAQTGASPEQTLLRAAVATYIWNLAGRRSAVESPAISGATAQINDPASGVSEAAAWRFGKLVSGDYKDLLPEWLTLAKRNGRTLPPQWVPVALDVLNASMRNEFSAVLGPTAQWLASQNPDWVLRDASREPSEERWNTGTQEERIAELKALRASDAARARAWIESTWANDPPDAREAFLQALLVGLSLDDEGFLEKALDDKRKGVRLAAAECLSRLPGSALVKRHLARLEPLVILEEKKSGLLSGLRKRKLIVELPAALDKPATRDGIEAKPPAQRKIGERTFWLIQMIESAPPTHWTTRFDCDARTFLEAALTTDYSGEMLAALTGATVRHPDRAWIEALSAAWIEAGGDTHTLGQALASMLTVAAPEHRATLLESQLRGLGTKRLDVIFVMLQTLDLPWTAPVTKLALDALSSAVRNERQQWSHARNTLDTWAVRCDIHVAETALPELLAICGESSPWRNALEQMNDIVEFRLAMTKELSS